MMTRKDRRELIPLRGYPDEVGVWLSALQDARSRTLRVVERIDPHWLDFVTEDGGESIGTILYHLAAIEASWLYEDILQAPFPTEIESLFPYDVRAADGKLTSVSASMVEHLQRLEKVRENLLQEFSLIAVENFKELRELPEYEISPMYALHHLMQHEAEHRSQMDAIRIKAKKSLGTGLPEETL